MNGEQLHQLAIEAARNLPLVSKLIHLVQSMKFLKF